MERRYKTQNKTNKLSFITNHIMNNLTKYLSICTVFIIGIIIGVIFVKNIGENQKSELVNYVNNFTNLLRQTNEIDSSNLLRSCLTKNLILAISLWFIGSTVIGFPIVYLIIGVRGFLLGYTISVMTFVLGASKASLFCICSLLLQNVISIPAIFAIAVSGIKVCISIFKDKRKENIKIEIFRHTIFCAIMLGVLIFACFVEAYISSNLLKSVINFM